MSEDFAISGSDKIIPNPQAILLIQLGDIGDVVLSLPCIKALRDNFPQARLVVAVHEKAAELLADCPWIDHLAVVKMGGRSLGGEIRYQFEFFRNLRSQGCEVAIDLRTGTRGAIMAFLSGARQRLAFYAGDGKLWRNRIFTSLLYREYTVGQHVIDYLLCLLRAFGIEAPRTEPALTITAAKGQRAVELLSAAGIDKPPLLIAMQPFSLWQYKELSRDKYITLTRHLINRHGAVVLLTGSPAEQGRAAEIVDKCGAGCYNLAGKTSIGRYAALLAECDLFIGVDSAGLHIAAAVGTATVSIFGPSAPASWAPVGERHLVIQKDMDCVPCRRKGCDNSERCRCLDELSAVEVCSGVDKMLAVICGNNTGDASGLPDKTKLVGDK